MRLRLPMYAVLIIVAAAVAGTFTLTYVAVSNKYQKALDKFSDEITQPSQTQSQTITLTGVGMELEYVALEEIFVVTKVVQNSEADISGVVLGDVVTHINSKAVTLAIATTIKAGDMLTVTRDIGGASERQDIIL